tara:strand:+ start:688 stop:954 length:267 start_codon:yes stop_codon:yes gene_type:complete
MTIFDLDDIQSEKDAQAVCDELVKEAIQATNSMRNKRNKIKRCESKIKMFTAWCGANKWRVGMKQLQNQFRLMAAAKEDGGDLNMWEI